jgi:hypothetical protein
MPSITTIVTVSIALIGVYIAFALLVSWVQEQIAGFVGLRSKTLVLGLQQLTSDDDGAFVKQLLSTVGEPFTRTSPPQSPLPQSPSPGGAPNDAANPPLAQKARSPWPLASATGWAYLRKFFNAKVPVAGDVRFPSYIASRDFVANLLTYANDTHLRQRASAVVTALRNLPPDVAAKLPPAVVAAAGQEVAAAQALVGAARSSADAIYALQAADVPGALLADLKNLTTTGSIGTPDAPADAQTLAALEAAAAALPSPLDDIMLARLRDAQGDYQRFVASLEQWYDDYMNRVSGWYKRCATLVTVYLSVLVVLVFNVDSIGLVRTFGANATLSSSVALFSTSLLQANQELVSQQVAAPGPGASPSPTPNPSATPAPIKIATTVACPPASSSAESSASPSNASGATTGTPCATCPSGFVSSGSVCAVDTAALRALPLGYPDPLYTSTAHDNTVACHGDASACWLRGFVWAGILKLLGWVLSVIALCLGAPFWFDVLRGIVNVRAAGSPPPSSADVRQKQAS